MTLHIITKNQIFISSLKVSNIYVNIVSVSSPFEDCSHKLYIMSYRNIYTEIPTTCKGSIENLKEKLSMKL